jgi:hypothetical protein
VEYAKGHAGINRYLDECPEHRLYGEWLVRHSLQYPETAYKKFYLFDVRNDDGYMHPDKVKEIANEYGIETVHVFGTFENPSREQLKELAGQSVVGDKGEGVVIKNTEFVNVFGDKCYAKIVTDDFKESNSITFGGNNKSAESYWEMYVVNKYMTLPRIEKVMNKLQPLVDRRLHLEHTPRVISTAYHDMLTEEIWDIQKKVATLDFNRLKRLVNRKAVQIYKDILNGDISVADKVEDNK